MSRLNEIWKDGKGKLSEEQLMAYLEGNLNAEEKYEIERFLSETGMESDALEGLRQIPAEKTITSVRRLNHHLNLLTQKKKRRTGLFKDNKWAWMAVVIVLLLCILGYWVLYAMNK